MTKNKSPSIKTITANKYEPYPRRKEPKVTVENIYADWGYEAHNGPNLWRGKCSDGIRQSPIDIRAGFLILMIFQKIYYLLIVTWTTPFSMQWLVFNGKRFVDF